MLIRQRRKSLSISQAALAVAVGLFLSAGADIPVAWAADGPPADLKPARVAGAGLSVVDLEGQRDWYAAKLGMTLLATTKSADGSPREYIVGYAFGPDTAIIDLQKWPANQPRPNARGWIVLGVPNAKGLADWLKTQGVDNHQMVANVSYSITDPEGNEIVLYTAGPEAARAAPVAVPQPAARCGSGPTRSKLLDAALRIMADGNPYETAQAMGMYTQGLTQQGIFDEEYAKCLRSTPSP